MDLSKTIRKKAPWSADRPEVEVSPLVEETDRPWRPGWCSYEYQLLESPDVEILCGGLNSKSETAAALWRQGHLLHFGFDLSPAEMNEAGRALLVNAIVYVARFTEDRAILEVRSPFAGKSARSRDSLAAWLEREDYPLDWFEKAIDPAALATAEKKDREGYRRWFERVRHLLRPDADARLDFDEESRALGVRYDRLGFFEKAIAALEEEETASAARVLLARYGPEGPGKEAEAADWKSWFEENGPYLFFSDWGGYRWYLDPLAKRRGIPTADLRGPSRADVGASVARR